MRKLFSLFLALLATTSLWAEDFSVGGIYYNYLDGNNVAVTYRGNSYSAYSDEYSGAVTIPETVTYNGITYSVTSIGEYTFYGCSRLTSITIPNSVTSIEGGTFRGCSSLTSITIPNSVTSIGDEAFNGCSGLKSMVVESGNMVYDSRENCNAIIETATNTLIAGCQNTIIPNSVTSIGECAFWNCSSLTSITIPNSVTSIGGGAFSDCSSLTSITIPNSVTSIKNAAFYGCSSLTSIPIPNSVTSIGEYTFYGCSRLTSITIPNSVTSIGDYAFAYCSSLTSVTIGNSVTSIGSQAFSGCSSLTSVTIGNSVTSIGDYAFYECSSLTSITIPNSVTSIGQYAFEYCTSLTSITIPNSVTSIGSYAFKGCSSLTSITIPNSVTSIGNGAFEYCSSLTSITIPNSVTSIGDDAFYECSSLTSITIPNSVTDIGFWAFYECSSLDTLTCLAMTPPALEKNVFYGCDNSTLFVPCAALSDYQLHEQWGQFATIECISSEETDTEDVIIESGTTTVIITWPTEEGADTYTIVIKKDGEVVCTLTFNSDGQLISIAFAPGRNGNHPAQYAEQAANGYRFTVTGLEAGTHYAYNIDVRDAANKTITSHAGEFTTESTTAVDNINTNNANIQKIFRDGQLIIVRDGVEYNAVGQEL